MADLFLCHILKHSATYDVQDVEICGESGNIFIRCVFAFGSQAKGCQVVIRNALMNITKNITRSGSPLNRTVEEMLNRLVLGSYEVLIFDIEGDGLVASTPSYVGNATVTGILTINSSKVDSSSAIPVTTTVTETDPSPTTGRRTMIVTRPIARIFQRGLHELYVYACMNMQD